jgi:hypothetical protein
MEQMMSNKDLIVSDLLRELRELQARLLVGTLTEAETKYLKAGNNFLAALVGKTPSTVTEHRADGTTVVHRVTNAVTKASGVTDHPDGSTHIERMEYTDGSVGTDITIYPDKSTKVGHLKGPGGELWDYITSKGSTTFRKRIDMNGVVTENKIQ